MTILWRDKMSVGNLTIDDEHKHLICLINSVEMAFKAPDHEDMVGFLVNQLYLYTKDHFTQEEQIMLDHNYVGYADHKLEHQKILDDIVALKRQIEQHLASKQATPVIQLADGASDEEPNDIQDAQIEDKLDAELVVLLRAWIMDHVLSTDQKLKPLFNEG